MTLLTNRRHSRGAFVLRAKDLVGQSWESWIARTRQPIAWTRTSQKLCLDQNGRYYRVPYGMPALHWLGGEPTLLREGAGTNSALGACSFGDGTYWTGNTAYTLSAATSCIAGQTAYLHANNVGTARIQAAGTFVNGQTDCLSAIFETSTATVSRIGIRDMTTPQWLCYVDFTWATKTVGTIIGVGTAGVIDLGNGRYRVWIAGTGTAAGTGAAGNSRSLYVYPCGAVSDASAAILHHAQFEANASSPSSPIVTVAGTVTRAADLISVAWLYAPAAMTAYVDCYVLGVEQKLNARIWQIGANSNPEFLVLNLSGTQLATAHRNDTTTRTSQIAAAASYGNRVETRGVLNADGSTFIGQSIAAAAETTSVASAANTLSAAFTTQTLFIGTDNLSANPGNLAIRSIAIVLQADVSMAAMRQIVAG